MADTFVPITAGSGTNVHAFTVNSKYRQCTVIGDSVADEVAAVTAANGLDVDVTRVSGTVTVGDGGSTLSVDDGGGALTVDGTVSLGAGSASVGTLGANSGVDIGDVTINNASGASAVNIQDGGNSITVDGTVAATQSGNWTARVADGAGNALTSKAPGSERALSVAIVDGSGAQVTSFGGSGGTNMTDDAAFTPASGAFTPSGGIVTSDSVDSGDGGAFAMLANRQQKVTLYDSSGVELAVGGGTQYVEDAAAAANPTGNALNLIRNDARSGSLTTTDGDNIAARGTNSGELYVKHVDAIPVTDNAGSLTVDGSVSLAAAIPAGTNNIGDVDVLTIAAGDNNIGNVDIVTMPNVTLAAGTNTNEVVGDVAQDAAIAGNPVNIGLRASTAVPSAMSGDGDAVYGWADRNGAFVVAGRIVDDAAFTPATDRVQPVGFFADETSTDSVDEGDAGIPRMTLDRRVITVPQSHAQGGLSIFRSLDLDETEEDVKTSAGCVYSVWFTNRTTSVRYLKFYNATAANVTVGTTTPVITIALPANATDVISGMLNAGGMGLQFDTAISAAVTTAFADADTGAPGTNDIIVNIFYK